MKLNKKECQIIKIKEYLKINKLFFLFNGVNKNSDKWIKIKQETMEFMFLKNFNKIANKKLQNSNFKNLKTLINGLAFFIKPKSEVQIKKDVLLYKFCPLLFVILAIKINNKIYPLTVFKKNINSLNYFNNNLLFYQFNIIHLKRNIKLF